MTTTAFDTLAIARRREAFGFSEEQAEAVTGVTGEARDIDLSALVTTVDSKTELSEAKFEILKWGLSAIGVQAIVIVTLSRSVH